MAALTTTKVGRRQPLGAAFVQAVRVTGATGAGSATEWINKADIGFTTILGAWPCVLGPTLSSVNFVLNEGTGTGGTEGTTPGSLAVESSAALTNNLIVFVYGK